MRDNFNGISRRTRTQALNAKPCYGRTTLEKDASHHFDRALKESRVYVGQVGTLSTNEQDAGGSQQSLNLESTTLSNEGAFIVK